MTNGDTYAIRELILRNRWLQPGTVVGPSSEDDEAAITSDLWGVKVRRVPQAEWNLDDPPHEGLRGDLVLVCNTMLCSTDPALWLANIAIAAPLVLIQDLAVARREPGRHCAVASGDVARYSISTHGVKGETDPDLKVFDLGTYDVLDVERYEDRGALKFAAIIRLR